MLPVVLSPTTPVLSTISYGIYLQSWQVQSFDIVIRFFADDSVGEFSKRLIRPPMRLPPQLPSAQQALAPNTTLGKLGKSLSLSGNA